MLLGLQMLGQWSNQNPEAQKLQILLLKLRDAEAGRGDELLQTPAGREAMDVYIAHHFGKQISDPAFMSHPMSRSLFTEQGERELKRIVAAHPEPTAVEVEAATKQLAPVLQSLESILHKMAVIMPFITTIMVLGWLFLIGLASVAAAVTFRGGLLWWAFGIDAVTARGVRASRWQLLGRSLLAWSPVLSLPLTMAVLTPHLGVVTSGTVLGLVILALAAWSLALPERGLPDRLAGTWLVPA